MRVVNQIMSEIYVYYIKDYIVKLAINNLINCVIESLLLVYFDVYVVYSLYNKHHMKNKHNIFFSYQRIIKIIIHF